MKIFLIMTFFLVSGVSSQIGCRRTPDGVLSEEHYSDGSIKERGSWIFERDASGSLTKLQHGRWESWYRDGTKKSSLDFCNGRIVGKARFWHPNGQIAQLVPYDDDGLPHGEVKWWNSDGELLATSRMNHGTGKEYYFHPDGLIRKEVMYTNGVPVAAER
ncbi:MAG: hypothetical protein K9N51_13725 [Candidatus Pacebacteria bacterium]|nr:hypothetical protein [Candidatus Paceibacterota bacterium]